ncbi:MAG: intradiol ring-cleavage dioxygenase [Chitinophagaceae bacterium]|nr:intradiol ring-cleavage dioxygenase [Chitinophagaceae bacterium]
MERKDFLKNGLLGLSSFIGISAISGKGKNKMDEVENDTNNCTVSPRETRGPFPTKTPSQLAQANIKSDRKGIAMLINLAIVDQNNNCKPLPGALVDIWHCDKDGNYSEYGNHPMQRKDFTAEHFLRGRQTADAGGQVSFLSIYPGWYHGRAPHIHLEIFNAEGKSLLVTQLAFPENINGKVYSSPLYADRGVADTSNNRDYIFSDSLDEQMAEIIGNVSDGFTLTKTIVVKA